MAYLPVWKDGSFFVRSSLQESVLSGIIRSESAASDKVGQVEQIHRFESDVDDVISEERLTAILSSAFAGLACLLAAVGLYGVVAYGISRRTNEFGIRIALGAQRSYIRRLVLRQTLPFVLVGVAIGTAAALALQRALSALVAEMLYGIKATELVILAGATISLVAIALLAAYLPARRASRVDPLVALRHE